MKLTTTWLLALAALATTSAARAEKLTFDFADPKGVNALTFLLDSALEPITGFATGLQGTVTVDPADVKSLTGEFEIATANLRTPNEMMTKVLHSPEWLDVQKHPAIRFRLKEVLETAPGAKPNVHRLTAKGDFTCNGVTKELTVTAEVTYWAGRLSERLKELKGDLVVLRSTFKIKRTDFNIKPDLPFDVVGEEIEIRMAVSGAAKR